MSHQSDHPMFGRQKKIIVLLIVGALVAVSFFVFTLLVELELVNLKHSLFQEFSKETGLKISYDSISPSLFNRLEVRGFEIKTADSNPREILNSRKIIIYYDPAALVFESNKLYAIRKIETSGIRLNIDENKDEKLLAFLLKLIQLDVPDFELPPIEIVGKNLGILYTQENNVHSLSGLFFSIVPDGEWFSLDLHSDARTETVNQKGKDFFLNSEFDISGSMHRSIRILDANVNFQSIEASSFVVSEQQFDVRLKNKTLVVTKIQDSEPLDFTIVYAMAEKTLAVNFISEDFSPSGTLTLRNGFEDMNPLLKTTVTSKGNVNYDIEEDDLDYRLEVDGYLPDEVIPIKARINTIIRGDNTSIAFEPFSVSSQIGSIQFVGNILYETMFPKGSLQLRDLETRAAGNINADLDIDRDARGLKLTGDQIMIGTAKFDRFLCEIFPIKNNYLFSLSTQLSAVNISNSIELSGNLSLEDTPSLLLDASLQNIPLDLVYQAVSKTVDEKKEIIELLDDMYVTAKASIETDFKKVKGKSDKVLIVQQGEMGNSLVFDVAFDTQQAEVKKFSGNLMGIPLSGNFHLQNTAQNVPHFSTQFSVRDAAYTLQGDIIPGESVVASGTYGILASLIMEENGDTVFFINADALPIPLKEATLVASLKWAGILKSNGRLEIAGRHTSISGFPELTERGGSPIIDASFIMRDNVFEISRLGVRDAISALTGNATLAIDYENQFALNGWFYLADNSDWEKYSGMFQYQKDDINAQLMFTQSPLSRFGDLVIRGNVNGSLAAWGSPASPHIDGVLSLQNGRFGFEPITADIDFSVDKDEFVLNSFSGDYSAIYSIKDGKGDFDFNTGEYSFEALFLAVYQDPIKAKLLLTGTANPFAKNDKEKKDALPLVSAVSGELHVKDIFEKNKELPSWKLVYSLDDAAFSIAGGPENTLYGALLNDGSFKVSFSDPFPLQGTLIGKIDGGRIDASADDVTLMITALNSVVNSDALVFHDGIAKGNISISGPISDPDLFGVFTIDNLKIGSTVLPDLVGPVNTVLQIHEKTLQFRESNTFAGNTLVAVSTDLIMDHWNISQYILNVKVLDQKGVHVVIPIGIASIDGFVVSPNFTLTGSYGGLSVAGDLFVQNTDFIMAKPDESGNKAAENPDSNIEVNLNIETGKQVEFFWPARELPILRLVSEPGARMQVKYNKLQDDLALTGDFNFNNGEVYYFERSFHVREGNIVLNENALSFDPLLSLRAERKVKYNDKDVKITMLVDNQRLSKFEPVFDSDPPLPVTERYLALGGIIQPQTSDSGDKYISSVVSDLGGDLLTQIVLLRPLEQKVKEIFDLDGFSIRTELIKNLLRDTVFTSADLSTRGEAISMGRYLNNTEISFQKYLDERNDLLVEAVFRIQSDSAVTGATAAPSDNFGNVSLESEVSIELTTPFFLTIKWTVTPEHWESFFLPDNKITLKWGMVF